MGKPSPTSVERGEAVLAGTFTGTGPTPWLQLHGNFNITIGGPFINTRFELERSFDGGATAVQRVTDIVMDHPCSFVINEPEAGVLYRLNCAQYGGTPVLYRLSQ
ncbi:hypothetical protein [Azospirillum sp. sgz301742]